MSIAASLSLPPQATYTDQLVFRLSVKSYHEMIQSGVLSEADPVELLEGVLVYKMPKNSPHSTATSLVRREIEELLPDRWFVRTQEPITLSDGEPEPDQAIVRGAIEDYASHHPTPPDTALIVEVSDSTLERDRTVKRRSYARAGIAEYWIVNLVDRRIEVYTRPDPAARPEPRFAGETIYQIGQAVPLRIGGTDVGQVPVDRLLPPAG